ncbi:ATPase [Mycobacterium sp.]|uniref:ATPase n=1 Tax=Mycobacterium sp. TaxID=1785 RepID=UPI003BAEE342
MEPSSPPFRAKPPQGADSSARTERLPSIRPNDTRQKPEPPSRSQRTRRTVDLPPATHRALDIWQREAADRLGFARVTGQEVISALIELLLIDAKLSAEVTRSIRERR